MRIAVAYRATDAGADALALGVRLAGGPGVELVLVTVLPSGEHPSLTPPQPSYDRHLVETAEGWLADAVAAVPPGVTVTSRVVHAESFAQGLVETVAEIGADLIVVGAATGGVRGRFTVGSLAGALLHSSPVPVALAPAGCRDVHPGVDRVTVAVGTRAGADAVLAAGSRLAASVDSPLRLVSLVALDLPGGSDEPLALRQAELHAGQALADVRALLGDELVVETAVATGDSIEQVVASLDWEPGEIVLVGSSRLAAPHRAFLGSIAAKMLRELPVPMIVVPRDHTTQGS